MGSPGFGAVVLAGGAARRLGGLDKATASVAGRPMLGSVLTACAAATATVVVGPRRELHPPPVRAVRWTREDPPGGGPVPALAAGLLALAAAEAGSRQAQWLLLVAVDLPFLTRHDVERLTAAAAQQPGDGALLVDEQGRRQYLAGCYRRSALQAAVHAEPVLVGARLAAVIERLSLREVPGEGAEQDCDTPAALAAARRRAADAGRQQPQHGYEQEESP